jgi:hypothetical protein
MHVVGCSGKEGRDGSNEQTSCECVSRTESIASRTSDQTDEQSCYEGDNVRVGDLILCQVQVFADDIVEQRRESVPGWVLAILHADRCC